MGLAGQIKHSIDIEIDVGPHILHSMPPPCSGSLNVINHPVFFPVVMAHIHGI